MTRPIFACWLIVGLLALALGIGVESAAAARGEVEINDLIGAFTPAQSAKIEEAARTARLSLVVVTDAIPFATQQAWKRWIQQHWVSADTITVAYHTTSTSGFIVVYSGSHVIISPQQVRQENERLAQDASTGNLAGAIAVFCYRFRTEIEAEKRHRLSIQQAIAFAQRMQTLSTLLLIGGVLVVNILALLRWHKARKPQAVDDDEAEGVIVRAIDTVSPDPNTISASEAETSTNTAKPRRSLPVNRDTIKRFIRRGRPGLRYALIGTYIIISAEYFELTWSQIHDGFMAVLSNGLHALVALSLGQVIARSGSLHPLQRVLGNFLRASVSTLVSGWSWSRQWWRYQQQRAKHAIHAAMTTAIQRLLGALPRRLVRRLQKGTTQQDKNMLPSVQTEVSDTSTSLTVETEVQQGSETVEHHESEAA